MFECGRLSLVRIPPKNDSKNTPKIVDVAECWDLANIQERDNPKIYFSSAVHLSGMSSMRWNHHQKSPPPSALSGGLGCIPISLVLFGSSDHFYNNLHASIVDAMQVAERRHRDGVGSFCLRHNYTVFRRRSVLNCGLWMYSITVLTTVQSTIIHHFSN